MMPLSLTPEGSSVHGSGGTSRVPHSVDPLPIATCSQRPGASRPRVIYGR